MKSRELTFNFRKKFLLVALLQLFFLMSYSQSFKVDDTVEAYNSGMWYKGIVVEKGAGTNDGYFKIQYTDYNQLQWIKASNIRVQKSSITADSYKNGPRNGMYDMLSYGTSPNPIQIGYFELQNGKYTYYNLVKKMLGQGTYSYDAASKTLHWNTGPFKDAKWDGTFEIDTEGKTQKIKLNSATIGSNSIDSD